MGFLLVDILWHLVCQRLHCQDKRLSSKAEIIGNLTFWHLACQKSAGLLLLISISADGDFVVPIRTPTRASQTVADPEMAIVRIVPVGLYLGALPKREANEAGQADEADQWQ
jgi:hypothetical protein